MRSWSGLALGLVMLLGASPARACPCQAGDPTLSGTSWGAARAGRVRLSLEGRWSTEGYGTRGRDRADVEDLRLEPSVVWSPMDWLVFSIVAPVAYRTVSRTNLTHEEHVGLADPEVRLRVRLLSDAGRIPRNTLGVSLGIDVPLMGEAHAQDGTPVSMEAMIGSGSADPSAGIWYVHHEGAWTLFAVAGWRFPTTGLAGMRMGLAFDAVATLQWQPLPELAFRLGPDARLEVPGTMSGAIMTNTGGFSARLGGDVVYAPTPEVMLTLGARVPFVQALHGAHDLGVTVLGSVIGDLFP